jgi:hypothetical protein
MNYAIRSTPTKAKKRSPVGAQATLIGSEARAKFRKQKTGKTGS